MSNLDDLEESAFVMAKLEDSEKSPLVTDSFTEFTYKMDKEMEQ